MLSFSGYYHGKKMYSIMNTSNYNEDGMWSVIVASHDELSKNGFSDADIERIETMQVGEQMTFDYGYDAQIVRLA